MCFIKVFKFQENKFKIVQELLGNEDNNNNNNNNNNNILVPETREYWVDVQQGIASSHGGEGSSLALVGNPSRDGVLIKILVWRHLKPNPQLL